jgi:hypothetical protein
MMLTSRAKVPSAHCGAKTVTLKNGVPNGTLTAVHCRYKLQDANQRRRRARSGRASAAPGESLRVKATKTWRTRSIWRRPPRLAREALLVEAAREEAVGVARCRG